MEYGCIAAGYRIVPCCWNQGPATDEINRENGSTIETVVLMAWKDT